MTTNRYKIVRLLAILCLVLIVVSLFTLRQQFAAVYADVQLYYKYALKTLSGQIPYRDFRLEYPPLALLPMILPEFFNFSQKFNLRGGYITSFLLENVIFTSAIALVLVQIARHWQPRPRSLSVLRVFILFVAIAAPILAWRYDSFPALLTLLALLSVIVKRPLQAGIFLGLGIMAKLYPVVLLPIFCVYYYASREYRGLFRLLLGCIGATCISLLPFVLTAGGDILSFLRYHYQRGLQIESLPAGLISLTHIVHITKASIVFRYGSHQIISPLAPIVQKWLPLITILAFVVVIANCLIDFRREYTKTGAIKTQTLVTYIVAALLTFMATGKVFSTQYIVWLLPFAPLLRPKQQAVMLLIFALTIFNYPFAYNQLKLFYTVPVLLLNLRNFLVVFLLLWLIARKSTSAMPLMPKRQPVAR